MIAHFEQSSPHY